MPVSGKFIREELSGMKTDKSTRLDDVSARFLKDGASFLVKPVKHIIDIQTMIVPQVYFYIYFVAFLGLRRKTVSSNCIRRFARRCESNRETKDTNLLGSKSKK